MKIASTLLLALASACVGASASRGTGTTTATAGTRSCSAPMVSSVARRGSDIYAAPDATSTVVATLKSDTPVCAEADSRGFGFRRVTLSDGRTGFVAEQSISQ
jgi:hypothetical protein